MAIFGLIITASISGLVLATSITPLQAELISDKIAINVYMSAIPPKDLVPIFFLFQYYSVVSPILMCYLNKFLVQCMSARYNPLYEHKDYS